MYRDRTIPGLAQLAQHVGIAEMLLDDFVDHGRRFEYQVQLGFANAATFQTLAASARQTWERMWAQLAEARGVLAADGRDLSAFDAARAAATAIWDGAAVEVGSWELGFLERRRTLSWRIASTEEARAALAALRMVVPELVIPAARAKPVITRDIRRANLVVWIVIALAVALIVAIVVIGVGHPSLAGV